VAKLTIVIPSKNQAQYIPDLLSGLKAQTFQDFQLLVIDAGSTDGTKKIFETYNKAKLIDINLNANDAILYGISLVDTKYLMIGTTSDYLYSIHWLEVAVNKLEADNELSLVWASSANINQMGSFIDIWGARYFHNNPPSKIHYFPYWLYSYYLPELNYVVRSAVYQKCIKNYSNDISKYETSVLLYFLFNFTKFGYLQEYIPEIAHAGRAHEGSLTSALQKKSRDDVNNLRLKQVFYFLELLSNKKIHSFRDGNGLIIYSYSKIDLILVIFKFVSIAIIDMAKRFVVKIIRY
jgi:glycosyltransferase involved in cell wall biosynthesis